MNTALQTITALLLPLLLGALQPKDQNPDMIESLLQAAQRTLAPDRRTAVFDVRGRIDGDLLILSGEVQSGDLKDKVLQFVREKVKHTVVDSMTALPEAALGGKTFGVVTMSVANLRARPAEAAEMVSQAILGTPLRVLKRQRGWCYVQTPDEYLGWASDGFALMSRDEFTAWEARPKVIVTTEFGFTRVTGEDTAQVVSDIVAGGILALSNDDGDYFEVQYPDGRVAYLPKRDGQPMNVWLEHADATPSAIVATARRFFGIPYLWGGTSCKGFDCSGFTKTVYYLNGMQLPRDASQQALVGDQVDPGSSFENVKVGDLLFFGSKATGERKERVTHVAIYLGEKRFIHCSGDVRINSLDPSHKEYSEHRSNSLLRIRRIIGSGDEAGVHKLSALPYYGKRGL